MSSTASYPSTWYADTAGQPPARPPVRGRLAAEVCVVGGGLAGLTTAFELARRGRSVILAEAHRIGWGASGRNGGFVSAGFAEGMTAVAARAGREDALALHRLSVDGVEYVRTRIAELDSGLRNGDGWIVAQRFRDPDRTRSYVDELNETYDRQLGFLGTEHVRSLLNSPRYFHGILDRQAFHVHPLGYCLALAKGAEAAGVVICEDSAVLGVEKSGPSFRVRTADGVIEAGQVAFCTSAFDRTLFRPLGRAVLPVATYIGVTEKLGARIEGAVRTNAAVSDTRRAGDYYRIVDGDRLLWGGRITTQIAEPERLAMLIRSDMLSVYPQLGDVRMDYGWSGLMAYAIHKMPIVAQLSPGMWVAAAFGGHGLNTTAMAGVMVARGIVEGDEEWKRLQSFGAPWAGGFLGRAGVQLSYWKMQLQDLIEERRSIRSVEG
jgi:gamma-glutamylputrescine oxidase